MKTEEKKKRVKNICKNSHPPFKNISSKLKNAFLTQNRLS